MSSDFEDFAFVHQKQVAPLPELDDIGRLDFSKIARPNKRMNHALLPDNQKCMKSCKKYRQAVLHMSEEMQLSVALSLSLIPENESFKKVKKYCSSSKNSILNLAVLFLERLCHSNVPLCFQCRMPCYAQKF
jgi:hypothetical protein